MKNMSNLFGVLGTVTSLVISSAPTLVQAASMTVCSTMSNGLSFTNYDYNPQAAAQKTLNMCMQGSGANSYQCNANLTCRQRDFGGAQPPGTGPVYPQPGYPQPGYPQPGYPQPGYPQPGYPQPGYPTPGYPQPGYGQISCTTDSRGYSFREYGTDEYSTRRAVIAACQRNQYTSNNECDYRASCSHSGGNYPQPGYPQPGYPQPGYPQPGYPQPGYGYGQQAWLQRGAGYMNPTRFCSTIENEFASRWVSSSNDLRVTVLDSIHCPNYSSDSRRQMFYIVRVEGQSYSGLNGQEITVRGDSLQF